MRDPIKLIRAEMRFSSALKRAAAIQKDPGFVAPPREQLAIETADMRHGLRHIQPGDTAAYNDFVAAKDETIIANVLSLVEQDKTDVANHSLELLSQYFGYPDATRMGGVSDALHTRMVEHNENVQEGETLIPQSVLDNVERLRAEQLEWPNQIRRERLRDVSSSLHRRYPADFLSAANSPAEEEHQAAKHEWC